MFQRVQKLIVFASMGLPGCDAELTQEQILEALEALSRCRPSTITWAPEVILAAIRLVRSSAWSLLWSKLRWQHSWGGSGLISAERLQELDDSLKAHFEPILEEKFMSTDSNDVEEAFSINAEDDFADMAEAVARGFGSRLAVGPYRDATGAVRAWRAGSASTDPNDLMTRLGRTPRFTACQKATMAVIGLEMVNSFSPGTIPPQVLALAIQLQAQACGTPTPVPVPTPTPVPVP